MESTAGTATKPASTKAEGTLTTASAGDDQRPGGRNRRLPARHRGPQAERHRHDLRAARHPDHRPHAPHAEVGAARHLVPARAERGLRGLDCRFPHAEARHLPDRVRARLPQRRHRAHACDGQLLSDDPDQRLLGARNRRPAAGRLRGNGPARDRQAAVQGGVSRAARRGHRRRRRARDTCRRVGTSRWRVPRPAGEALSAGDGRGRRQELAHQGRGCRAPPDSRAGGRQARRRSAEEREEAAHHSRQGCGVRAGRCRHSRAGREDRHSLSADVDGQGPAAGHARAVRVGRALVRAARGRRRDADRRALELAAVAGQGQDVGRRHLEIVGRPEIRADRHLAAGSGQQRAHRRAGGRRHRLVRVGDARAKSARAWPSRPPSGRAPSPSARTRTSRRWPRRSRRIRRR